MVQCSVLRVSMRCIRLCMTIIWLPLLSRKQGPFKPLSPATDSILYFKVFQCIKTGSRTSEDETDTGHGQQPVHTDERFTRTGCLIIA